MQYNDQVNRNPRAYIRLPLYSSTIRGTTIWHSTQKTDGTAKVHRQILTQESTVRYDLENLAGVHCRSREYSKIGDLDFELTCRDGRRRNRLDFLTFPRSCALSQCNSFQYSIAVFSFFFFFLCVCLFAFQLRFSSRVCTAQSWVDTPIATSFRKSGLDDSYMPFFQTVREYFLSQTSPNIFAKES